MINKINFYSLEQFILADAQALQAHVFDYTDLMVEGLVGGYGGSLNRILFKSFDSETETLTLQPFKCVIDNKVMKQEDISFNISSIATLAAAYYNTNNNMNDFPTTYLYGRLVEENYGNETRNFWSPIDQASIQQDVDTRKRITLDLRLAFSQPPAVGGFEYQRLATVTDWHISVNIDSGANVVRPLTFAANFVFNNYFSAIRVVDLVSEGLRGPFFAVEAAIDNLLRFGQNDPASTDTTVLPGGQPTMSLQGLAAFVGNNIHKVRARIHFIASPNASWPSGEVDFNNLPTIAPYTEFIVTTDGTGNPDYIGFDGVVAPHNFDSGLFALPFDASTVLSGSDSLGSGADTNMYTIANNSSYPLNGPEGSDIDVNTVFGFGIKTGIDSLWGFAGSSAYGGPMEILNPGGGLAWPAGNSSTGVTFWTNLTQNKSENMRYDEMVKQHFINYNGRVIDGYENDENGMPQPVYRDTPTYLPLPAIRFVCTIKA